jgi:hypothetical protein
MPIWMVAQSGGEPNWIVTCVVGAILGVLATYFAPALGYPFRRLKKSPLERLWYEYHFSYLGGRLVLRQAKLKVRKGILSRYVVTFDHERSEAVQPGGPFGAKELSYKGSLKYEHDHILLALDGVSHEESLSYRFINKIPSNDSVLPGIWMSYDHDLNPASGTAILSKDQLSPDDAISTLRKWTISGQGGLRVPREPVLRRTRSK